MLNCIFSFLNQKPDKPTSAEELLFALEEQEPRLHLLLEEELNKLFDTFVYTLKGAMNGESNCHQIFMTNQQ